MNPDNGERGSPPQLLLELATGALEPDEVAAVELLLRADGLTPPPPFVRRRAERIIRQRQPPGRVPRWVEPARRVVAALTFDSRVQQAYAGLRATTAATHVRRLLFQAANVEVDLEMTPGAEAEQLRLAGQITAGGIDPNGGLLRLSTPEGEWLAQLDESGEFWLDSLSPGAYRLEVLLHDQVIEVPVLPI